MPQKVPTLISSTDRDGVLGAWPLSPPVRMSGPVEEVPGETWLRIDTALREGRRGLPGGTSLSQLLAPHRGARRQMKVPLKEEEVLAWAEAHRQRTGAWPTRHSGPIPEAPGRTWAAVNSALSGGGVVCRVGAACGRCWSSDDRAGKRKEERPVPSEGHGLEERGRPLSFPPFLFSLVVYSRYRFGILPT